MIKNSRIAVGALLLAFLSGCTGNPVSIGDLGSPVQEDITSAVKVEENSVSCREAEVYVSILQNGYDQIYGSQIWQQNYDTDRTWAAWALQTIQMQIMQTEIFANEAEKENMTLSQDQKQSLQQDVEQAQKTLSEYEQLYAFDEKDIAAVYERSMLAAVYAESLTKDIVLSEQEAKDCQAIQVQQIFLACTDENEEKVRNTLEACKKRILDKGEDFETLAAYYGTKPFQIELIIDSEGKELRTQAVVDSEFCKEAWKLEKGDISEVCRTADGCYLIKCVDRNDDQNLKMAEESLLAQKKEKVLLDKYNELSAQILCEEGPDWRKVQVKNKQ